MNFEPWKHGGNEEWEPPSNVKWAEDGAYLLPFVRMAWIWMYKTKPELETLAEELEDEPFEEMVEGIHHSLEFFENFVTVLQAAEIRIMCAASAVELRRWRFGRDVVGSLAAMTRNGAAFGPPFLLLGRLGLTATVWSACQARTRGRLRQRL
jgi:hypothetical protein